MIFGDLHTWASQCISVDERLLERISVVWPACISVLSPQPYEDAITINLVDLLWKDSVVRRICHCIEYQFEPTGTDSDSAKFSKGKIDIAIFLDWNRDRYLAYECKRLNVIRGGKRSSQATAYVTEGMMRFIDCQYADGIPVGCMLGYVIDGDISFAINQLTKAITSHKPLGLIAGPTESTPVNRIERFQTTHTKTTEKIIELRHALLSLKPENAKNVKEAGEA